MSCRTPHFATSELKMGLRLPTLAQFCRRPTPNQRLGPFMRRSSTTFKSTVCPLFISSAMAALTSWREKPMLQTLSITCNNYAALLLFHAALLVKVQECNLQRLRAP